MATGLRGNLGTWQLRYVGTWIRGYMATGLRGYLGTLLRDLVDAWLHGHARSYVNNVNKKTHIIPLYIFSERHEKTIWPFFFKKGEQSHYCVVNNMYMSALVGRQVSAKEHKKYVCDSCLNHFGSLELLDNHVEYCSKHDD